MADSSVNLNIVLQAIGGASVISSLSQVASAVTGGGGLLSALGGVTVAAGAAAIGLGITAVKAAGDFQSGLTSLVTGAGEVQSNLGLISDGLLKMSVDTATSTKSLNDGLYMIESAGYHGQQGLDVLKAAAEGAKVGNADLGTVSNALTTILTDYHLSADKATSTTNALIATVADGKTHMQDLSSALGAVLPLASSLGISFPQVAGGIAVMTNSGMSAQQASQNLANTIRSLAAPNQAAEKAMKSVGLTAQQLKDTLSTQGLSGAIQLVSDQVGKSFPAGSVDAVEAFKKIMGGATGYNVALMLGGKNMDAYKGNINSISKAMNSGGKEVTGWSDVQKTFNFQMDQANQAVNGLMIQIGTALLPVVGKIVEHVTPVIKAFGDWIEKNHVVEKAIGAVKVVVGDIKIGIDDLSKVISPIVKAIADWTEKHHPLQTAINIVKSAINDGKIAISGLQQAVKDVIAWFNQWHPLILSIAGAVTLFFLPALIKAGIEAAVSGTKIAVNFVQSLISTGVEAVTSGTMITVNFIKSVITSGVEAVVAGAKIVANFVKSLITAGLTGWQSAGKLAMFIGSLIASGAQAVINGVKIAASFVASLIQSGIQAAVSAGIMVASLIPAIVSTGLAALAAAAPFIAIGLVVAAVVVGIVLAIQHWGQIMAWIQGVATNVWNGITGVWGKAKDFFAGIGKAMFDGIKSGINWIIGGINSFIGFIDGIQLHIPSVGVGPIHTPSFDWNGVGIPKIPLLGDGGDIRVGGAVIVGDKGRPELLNLPAGASVTPLGGRQSAGVTVVNNYYISTMARNQAEVRRLFDMMDQEQGRRFRLQTPNYALGGIL